MRKIALIVALVCAPVSHAAEVFADISKETIARVIDAPGGVLRGNLEGDALAGFQAITRSTEPVLAQITVVKRFKQEGCARVQLDFRQEKVPTITLQSGTFVTPPIQMNLCRDGVPPAPADDVPLGTWKTDIRAK